MRRICCVSLLLANLCVALLLGCDQKPSGKASAQPQKDGNAPNAVASKPGGIEQLAFKPSEFIDFGPQDALTPIDAEQEKYDAALLSAIQLLSEKKYSDALVSMEAAAKFKDTELVRAEIQKLRSRIALQTAAERTLQDIQSIFDQGNVAEASQLATSALQEYGSTDVGPALIKVKLQADALAGMQLKDNAARHKAFRDQAEAAEKDGNLRAALIAYEQALQSVDEAPLRQRYDGVRAKLTKYDNNRQKAVELRKDPADLEEAIELLKEAAKLWDTAQIRQDIDEYTFALQKRRDRIAVADFETRGDVGIPTAGRTVAEELLPYFKGRYDLVERGQVAKVLDELKLESGNLTNFDDQREISKLAKVRYLVIGSVSRFGGLTVGARLVDAQSGLVVQTAKITANTPEEAINKLPELAKLLMMTDQERLIYDQELIKQAQPVPVVQVQQPLPPPPEVLPPGQPLPPPVILSSERPPELGGARIEDFKNFQPEPQPTIYGGAAEDVWKQKAFQVSLLLGDDLFRQGRHHEALRRFEFGLTLGAGNFALDIRINRLRPLLPPPPVVIVVPLPPPPRIAIVDFVVVGDPFVVPPGLSWTTPRGLAPYFSPPYELVDRGELYWWMGRLGMTVRDLMVDPYARRWLGRALNVRYFVFGTVTQTASFNVDTYLVDAEYGVLAGRGFVHVHNPLELRYRLGELAQLTQTPPNLWLQQQQQYRQYEDLVARANIAAGKNDFKFALSLVFDAQKLRPKSIELVAYRDRWQALARQQELADLRRLEFENQQKLSLARKLRQEELAREAERQRILVLQRASGLGLEQKLLFEKKRQTDQLAAHNQLLAQARVALKIGNFQLSIQTFESAVALHPSDDVYRELAVARAELDRTNKQRLIEEAKLRDIQQQQKQVKEVALAKAALEAERLKRLAEESAARKVLEAKDNAEYQKLIDLGQKQMANQKYNEAISSFQAARRLKKTDLIEGLLNQALVDQARVVADAKGAAARKELEQKLAEEKELRIKAEAEAKVNQDKYLAILKTAQKSLAGKEYETAIAHFNDAGRLYKTDAVLTGLQQAQAGLQLAKTEADAAKQKLVVEQTKQRQFKTLMSDGQTALLGKDFGKAVDKFSAANKLIPDNVDALAALSKAEQARDRALQDARTKIQDEERTNTFKRLMKDSQDNISRKQFDAAVANLTEALKLNPGDADASKALKTAQSLQAGATKNAQQLAEAKKKTEDYQKVIGDGRFALQNKQYDAAIKLFEQAQKFMPGDSASQNLLKEAQSLKKDQQTAIDLAAKQKAAEFQLQIDLKKALGDGRAALAGKNLAAAEKAIALAVKLSPTDPAVVQLQGELQRLRDAAQSDALAQQKRKTQFDALMSTAKQALDAKQFDAALKALNDANAVMPGDKLNQSMISQVQQQQQLAAKTAGDLAVKKNAFDLAIKQGQALLAEKKFDDAIKQFQFAAAQQPGDPLPGNLLKQAELVRNQESALQQKLGEFNRLIKEGSAAMAAKKFDQAVQSFRAAIKLNPGDPNAAGLLKQAEQARNQETAGQQKSAEFNKLMKDGNTALGAKKFEEAVQSFGAAVKLNPGDANAVKSLQNANKLWDASKGPPGPNPAQIAEYNKQMQLGASFDKQKKFPDAIKAYEAALGQLPKDGKATEAHKKATYNQHMVEGNRFITARQFPQAVAEFEAALRLYPKDADATAGLKKAKEAK